jgi:hypothetical protein
LHRQPRNTTSQIGLAARVLGAALTLCFVGMAPAGADTDPQSSGAGEPLVAALDRIEAGTWTEADLDLVRQHPDIAAQVPDPSQPPEPLSIASSGGTRERTATTKAASALTTICGAWVDAWFQKKSILGNSIYKWHHYVRYCRNGSVVTTWQARYDYITDQQSGVYVREQTVNSQWGLGTNSATSHIQRHLEFCILKLGCYENHLPWSRITVHGNGTYSWTGSTG